MKLLLIACIVAMVCGSSTKKTKGDDNKVKIALYYESLCPDSRKFITSQLAPVWRNIRGGIKVKLVPYGKATHDKVNGKWQFTCQHGPEECYGNKLHACILKDKELTDTKKMEMVICMMNSTPPLDQNLETCLNEQEAPQDLKSKIIKCAQGQHGDNLLATYGDKTDVVQRPLGFVPTIIINEKFDQPIQEEAFKDLKSVVCRVSTNKPTACL